MDSRRLDVYPLSTIRFIVEFNREVFMEQRNTERKNSELIPATMSVVELVINKGLIVNAEVINICSHGVRLRILNTDRLLQLPRKNDTFKVKFKSFDTVFSGMCVYLNAKGDESLIMGVYFTAPSEQNVLHVLLRKIAMSRECDKIEFMKPFVKHEWEELLDMMCHSDNPLIREKGLYEQKIEQMNH